jgi:hypothetical protein
VRRSGPPVPPTPSGALGVAVLVGSLAGFALLTDLPWILALAIAASGAGGSVALRQWGGLRAIDLSAAPALVAIAALALGSPPTPLPSLAAGIVAVAVLVWLADDPRRAPGSLRRATPTVLAVTFALGIVWGCTLLLARTTADVGVAGALLAISLFLIVVVLGRPRLLEPRPAAAA